MPKIYRDNICKQCGNIYSGVGKFFCSQSCSTTYKNLTNNPAKKPEIKEKIRNKMLGNKNCQGRELSIETKQKIANSLKGKKLTEEHKKRISSALKGRKTWKVRKNILKGEKHPNWKGGTSPQRQKEYGTKEYKDFVKAVLKRDNYTCQNCGRYGGKLNVHHIKSYAEYSELRFEISNGLTLCDPCHKNTLLGEKRPIRLDKIHPKKICQKCGKEFQIRNGRKFCEECKILICIQCNTQFKVRNGKYNQKFCSRDCYNEWMIINNRGENNSNWKGGISYRKK